MLDMLATSLSYIGSEFIVIYIWVVPLLSIWISSQLYVYYQTVMIENTSAEFRQNIFTSVIIMVGIYLGLSILIAYNVYAEGRADSYYYYTNRYWIQSWTSSGVMLEFFSITLKGISLIFIITTNIVFFAALIACKNLGFDRGYCIDDSTSSKDNLNNKNKGVIQYNKNPDFYYIALLLRLHVVTHFMFLTENLLVMVILFEWSAYIIIIFVKNFSKNMSEEDSEKIYIMKYLWFFFSVIPATLSLLLFYKKARTFYMPTIIDCDWSDTEEYRIIFARWVFWGEWNGTVFLTIFCLLLPCMIRLCICPVHRWLVLVYTHATTEVSMVVAGISITTGFFLLITFILPIFFKSVLVSIIKYIQFYTVVVSPVYLWFIWFERVENPHKYKKTIAYWSSIKLSLAVGCMFRPAEIGVDGVILFAVAHAISSIGLIYLVGFIYDRVDPRIRRNKFINSIEEFKKFFIFVFLTIIINIGCTGSILYVAQCLMISGLTINGQIGLGAMFTVLFLNLISYGMVFFFFQIINFSEKADKRSFYNSSYFFKDDPKKKYIFLETKEKKNQSITIFSSDWFILFFLICISFGTGLFSEFIIDFIKSHTTTMYSHYTIPWEYRDIFEDKQVTHSWWAVPKFFYKEDWTKIMDYWTQIKRYPRESINEIYWKIEWMKQHPSESIKDIANWLWWWVKAYPWEVIKTTFNIIKTITVTVFNLFFYLLSACWNLLRAWWNK